jgi:hypothetical protein
MFVKKNGLFQVEHLSRKENITQVMGTVHMEHIALPHYTYKAEHGQRVEFPAPPERHKRYPTVQLRRECPGFQQGQYRNRVALAVLEVCQGDQYFFGTAHCQGVNDLEDFQNIRVLDYLSDGW